MKDLKISKELLSTVLYGNLNYIDSLKLNDIIGAEKSIQYVSKVSGRPFDYINIYEFAFKCKEWALTKGYFIYSTNELSFIKTFSLETIETFSNGKDTEIECIFKACEWILKEQSNDTK